MNFVRSIYDVNISVPVLLLAATLILIILFGLGKLFRK
jgi:hypothetical protein